MSMKRAKRRCQPAPPVLKNKAKVADAELRETYMEGKDHYGQIPFDNCPYETGAGTEISEDRVSWMVGWLDRQTEVKFGELFKKYGV